MMMMMMIYLKSSAFRGVVNLFAKQISVKRCRAFFQNLIFFCVAMMMMVVAMMLLLPAFEITTKCVLHKCVRVIQAHCRS